MNTNIATLAIGFAVIATLIGWLVITAPARQWVKWLLIPATLAYAWYLAVSIPELMGRAFDGWPQGKTVTYLDHRITAGKPGQSDRRIEVWLRLPDGTSRLYSLPFNEELAKELDAAHQALEKGQSTVGRLEQQQAPGTAGTSGVWFELKSQPRINPYAVLPPKTIQP